MLAQITLNKDIVTLARQGGIPLRERIKAEEAAAAAAAAALAEKESKAKGADGKSGGKSKGGGSTMGKSQSAPMIEGYKTASAVGGQGGGWLRKQGVDLSKFTGKLDELKALGGSLEYSEKPFWRTALWQATWKNNFSIVKLLFRRGASITKADYQGRTPLHEAAFYGHLELVDFFLDHGHPIDCVDIFGQTPLIRAVECGRAEVVKRLVQRGAATNVEDSEKVTAQHAAAFRGMPTMSKFLLYNGSFKNYYTMDPVRGLAEPSKSPADRTHGRSRGSLAQGGAGILLGTKSLPRASLASHE